MTNTRTSPPGIAGTRRHIAQHRSALSRADGSAVAAEFKRALEKQLMHDVVDKYDGEDGVEYAVACKRIDRLVRKWLERAEKNEQAWSNILDRIVGKAVQTVEANVTLSHEDWLEQIASGADVSDGGGPGGVG